MLYYPVDAGTHRGVVSLSELNGVVPSTLFGVFCPLEGWGSRTCEESADGELAIIYGHLPEADKKM
jgi:hypothetical protein